MTQGTLAAYLVVSALIRKVVFLQLCNNVIFVFLIVSPLHNSKKFDDLTSGSRDIAVLAILVRADFAPILA